MPENEPTADGVRIDEGESPSLSKQTSNGPLVSSSGWDGKLRMAPKTAVLTNPEALSDPEYSDPEAPPAEQIEADEDLLDDYPPDSEDIDLVHCRVSSIPALRLDRFNQVQRLCLRQNAVTMIDFPPSLGNTLYDLDLYDNLISHIKNLDSLPNLTSLDLSFNKIKHIKNLSHLSKLKDLYLVQNKISKIENLAGLTSLTQIELAANRIRDIENLEPLAPTLQELWLGKNKITEIRNLDNLTSLRQLDLKSNRLTSLSGLSSLVNLEELYVSHNAISTLSGLDSNIKLRVLDISNNLIKKLENISHLSQLEEFWASTNEFSDFKDVEKELSDKEHLETVYFEGNPLQLMGPAVYRNKVRLALPRVRQIDASKSKSLYV
jgi:protein phosphatase 1 regulatory subunit 7